MQKQVRAIRVVDDVRVYNRIIPVSHFEYGTRDGIFFLNEVTLDGDVSHILFEIGMDDPGWSVYLEDEYGRTVSYDGCLYQHIGSDVVSEGVE